jgi:hypothetical protein
MSSSSRERPYQTKLRLEREAIHEFVDRDSTSIVMSYLPDLPGRPELATYLNFQCVASDLSKRPYTLDPPPSTIHSLLYKGMMWSGSCSFKQKRLNTYYQLTHYNCCKYCQLRSSSLHANGYRWLRMSLEHKLKHIHKIEFT